MMIHDDPDECLSRFSSLHPEVLPYPNTYFQRIRQMTDRELKLVITHLHEEKKRRVEERTKILNEIPSKKRKKKKNAQL